VIKNRVSIVKTGFVGLNSKVNISCIFYSKMSIYILH
jgi:hypothetical protein